jgi:hypothetical protein
MLDVDTRHKGPCPDAHLSQSVIFQKNSSEYLPRNFWSPDESVAPVILALGIKISGTSDVLLKVMATSRYEESLY